MCVHIAAHGCCCRQLQATDSSGAIATVYSWAFKVIKKPSFATTAAWAGIKDALLGRSYLDSFTVGEAYTLAKPNLTRAELFRDQTGDVGKITFAM